MGINALVAFISETLGALSVAWILSISPRFKKPPIGFVYPKREGIIATSLFVLILIFSFIYYSFNPTPLRPNLIPSPAPVINLTQALIVAGISLVPFVVALFIRRQPPKSTGWYHAVLTPSLQMGAAIAILTLFLRNRVMDILGGITSDEGFALLTALGIALAEETIFRGYIQMRLSWWIGHWQGIVITAAMYALWQLPSWINQAPLETSIILFALTLVQGLVLGFIMRKSGHILSPALYRAASIWLTVLA